MWANKQLTNKKIDQEDLALIDTHLINEESWLTCREYLSEETNSKINLFHLYKDNPTVIENLKREWEDLNLIIAEKSLENQRDENQQIIVDILAKNKLRLQNTKDDYGNDLLQLAVLYTQWKFAKVLIEQYGMDPNKRDRDGYNLLQLASLEEDKDSISFVKYLIKDQRMNPYETYKGWGKKVKSCLGIIEEKIQSKGGETPYLWKLIEFKIYLLENLKNRDNVLD